MMVDVCSRCNRGGPLSRRAKATVCRSCLSVCQSGSNLILVPYFGGVTTVYSYSRKYDGHSLLQVQWCVLHPVGMCDSLHVTATMRCSVLSDG